MKRTTGGIATPMLLALTLGACGQHADEEHTATPVAA